MSKKQRKPGMGLDVGRHWTINVATLQELRTIVEDCINGELAEAGSYVLDYGISRMVCSLEDMGELDDGFRVDFLAGVMSAVDEFADIWPGYEYFAAA